MAFEYEVGKTYLAADGVEVEITGRRAAPAFPAFPTGATVCGTRRGAVVGGWYRECDGTCFVGRYPPLTRQLASPSPAPADPLVFEAGKCYADGGGETIRILLVREAADELVGEVEGAPTSAVRRYRLVGRARGPHEHLVAAVPPPAMPPLIDFTVFYNGCWLQPNPATLTPYQSLLLCRFLQYHGGGISMPTQTIAAILEATKEHWEPI